MKILIGGGGTGGHIYPALALARYALAVNPENSVLFVGSAKGLENKIVPSAGFDLHTIAASGFKRNVKGVGRTLSDLRAGIKEAKKIITDYKPSVIFGTGGYVAAPLVIAGLMKGYPVVLHEQNALPGMTNRWLAPFTKKICLSFAETAQKMSFRSKTVLTGNPRASEVKEVSREEGASYFNLDLNEKTVLIYGGSRGAEKLNQVVSKYIEKSDIPANINLIYITGEIYFEEIGGRLSNLSRKLKLYPYLDQMPFALAAADLVVTRSGATTLAEITALGIPAILIPSPNVVNNHQYYNARILADKGAALLIEEDNFNEQRLAVEIERLLDDPQELLNMGNASKSLGMPDAAARVYRVLEEVAL